MELKLFYVKRTHNFNFLRIIFDSQSSDNSRPAYLLVECSVAFARPKLDQNPISANEVVPGQNTKIQRSHTTSKAPVAGVHWGAETALS